MIEIKLIIYQNGTYELFAYKKNEPLISVMSEVKLLYIWDWDIFKNWPATYPKAQYNHKNLLRAYNTPNDIY